MKLKVLAGFGNNDVEEQLVTDIYTNGFAVVRDTKGHRVIEAIGNSLGEGQDNRIIIDFSGLVRVVGFDVNTKAIGMRIQQKTGLTYRVFGTAILLVIWDWQFGGTNEHGGGNGSLRLKNIHGEFVGTFNRSFRVYLCEHMRMQVQIPTFVLLHFYVSTTNRVGITDKVII